VIIWSALLVALASAGPDHRFVDVTDAVGLGPEVVGTAIARACFADLDDDGRADVVVDRHRIFVNVPDPERASPIGRRFVEVPECGLPKPRRGDLAVFADLDNDGSLDAVVTRYVDRYREAWEDDGRRTAWLKGNGDGTFGPEQPIEEATPATTCAIAVGDVNRDGWLDLWLGNWYVHYGETLAAYENDLLVRVPPARQAIAGGVMWRASVVSGPNLRFASDLPPEPRPSVTRPDAEADEVDDDAGRPTYGAMIAELGRRHARGYDWPELIELNYGRRWNRCYQFTAFPRPASPFAAARDIAPTAGLDGDAVRHGRHPDWLKERAKTDPRFDRADEKPFRANGNTFDCAVGDIDNDGDFDLFLAEITHGWAGASSDRSRFLINRGGLVFENDKHRDVDRVPSDARNWNQGDLFCELADLDHDGRLDLLLASGDYPDNQRLRLFRQQKDGAFGDETAAIGIDHDGAQQISLADVDGDGGLDILVGQTFFRYSNEMKAGREPRLRLFVNRPPPGVHSLTIRLQGDLEQGTNRDALGAIVTVTAGDVTRQRQLIGVAGHAGKQHDLLIHFGLGTARDVDSLRVIWPDAKRTSQVFKGVPAGRYGLRQGGSLVIER
jgi:hypothetical protein